MVSGAPAAVAAADPRLARVAWSRLAEPGDEVAVALVNHLGAGPALDWLREAGARGDVRLPGVGAPEQARGVSEPAPGAWGRRAGSAVGPGASVDGGVGAVVPASARLDARTRLARAVARWTPRLEGLDPERDLRHIDQLGGAVLVPGDADWPASLDDLGPAAPLCLWVRGGTNLAALADRSVAVVGARAATGYGIAVAGELGSGLADRSMTCVSGGAYGIDAAAHRGSLAAVGRTVAFLAGGIDRPYPAGHVRLLAGIAASGGAVVSELPPGSAPTRVRFLLRNRLIAAFSRATVVVEAAWRSGALATAGRAAELLRPVGAVPGPVTSAASAGCHRLLRETDAVCITDAAEAAELAGRAGELAPEHAEVERAHDDLGPVATRAWEALPVRSTASAESVARAGGLGFDEALSALGRLEVLGRVERVGGGWRRKGCGRGE